MSPEEFGDGRAPPAELWRHFGFASGRRRRRRRTSRRSTHVPAFLDATGITFQNLIDLVSTRFVNADNQLQLETPSPDCNPDTVRIVGLDEARLSRMLRLIRLQRRLGWSFADSRSRAHGLRRHRSRRRRAREAHHRRRISPSRLDRPARRAAGAVGADRHVGQGQPVRPALHDAGGDVARRRTSARSSCGRSDGAGGDRATASTPWRRRCSPASGSPARSWRCIRALHDAARRRAAPRSRRPVGRSIASSSWRARCSCASRRSICCCG